MPCVGIKCQACSPHFESIYVCVYFRNVGKSNREYGIEITVFIVFVHLYDADGLL